MPRRVNIVHMSAGRIRLQCPDGAHDELDLDAFLTIDGVTEATYNKLTGSLLLTYEAGKIEAGELLGRIRERFSGARLVKTLRSGPVIGSGELNSLSGFLYSAFGKANGRVRGGLDGRADLTSLIPVVLGLLGVEELIRNPVMPRWYDFMRAAESMFMHFRRDYLEEESHV